MNPQFADEEPLNPFDFWEGAPFKLKIRNVEGYRNYDKSEFGKPEALFDSDEKIEEVYRKAYSLQAFLNPSNFKTYEELQARLVKVLDETTGTVPKAEALPAAQPKPAKVAVAKQAEESPFKEDSGDDDDSLEFFKKLANK